MLRRFCLYGFLKNQQYYEPFFLLALVDKGLSYSVIGLLYGFREIMINLFEIPSGAVADVYGRRKSMILSFTAYIVSFAIFGLSKNVWLLFAAMFFFAIGDAFRTGTHKAMIFTWLRLQGREKERTKVYGITRSWSKIGSAMSVVLAGILVFASKSYVYIFYFCIIPYVLGIVNFIFYPRELDGGKGKDASLRATVDHLREAFTVAIRESAIRRLVAESMGFEGVFKAAKDYIQPVIKASAVLLIGSCFADNDWTEPQQAAVLIGPVFFVLYLLSAAASRNAHRLVSLYGHEDRTARYLWAINALVFAALLPVMYCSIEWAVILGFIALYIIQNFWRPVLIARFDAHSSESHGATVLSIESQGKSLATALIAPFLGFAVDTVKTHGPGGEFWPIAALGLLVAVVMFATASGAHSR